jgi:hypothetical protein
MPTTASITFGGQKLEPYDRPQDAQIVNLKLGASLTLAKGTVLGRITASNLWKAYANGNSDGSEVARAILQYDVATDANGKHYFGTSAASEHGQSHTAVPAYISGNFRVADLTGLDANGLADFNGQLVFGDDLADANAVIHIG